MPRKREIERVPFAPAETLETPSQPAFEYDGAAPASSSSNMYKQALTYDQLVAVREQAANMYGYPQYARAVVVPGHMMHDSSSSSDEPSEDSDLGSRRNNVSAATDSFLMLGFIAMSAVCGYLYWRHKKLRGSQPSASLMHRHIALHRGSCASHSITSSRCSTSSSSSSSSSSSCSSSSSD